MLAAVAFEARFTEEPTVFSILPLPPAKDGIVRFMLATRAIRVCPITEESSLEEKVRSCACVLACCRNGLQGTTYRVNGLRLLLALLGVGHVFGRVLFRGPLNRNRKAALLILIFNGSASLPLVVKLFSLALAAQVVCFILLRVLDNLVEKALLAVELAVVLRPGDFGFVILAGRNHVGQAVIVKVVNIRNLVCNVFCLGLGNAVDLERILRATLLRNIGKKHLVVHCPVLVCLLEQELRVDARISVGVELPPPL